MLPAPCVAWEISDVTDSEDLRGQALYDALMLLKPEGLAETDWAATAGVNRGFFTNLKGSNISPRSDTLRKLLRQIGKTEAQLYARGRPIKEWAGSNPQPDLLPSRSVDAGESVGVLRMDMSYAMGPGTNLDESYFETETIVFDVSFLRSLTPSSPALLRVVSGVGDSMFPTIHDREDLIIDVGQRILNMHDRIWAISLFGAGALKRLQPIGNDRVLVISDNPDVPNQEVSAADITIVGRLVGAIRRH